MKLEQAAAENKVLQLQIETQAKEQQQLRFEKDSCKAHIIDLEDKIKHLTHELKLANETSYGHLIMYEKEQNKVKDLLSSRRRFRTEHLLLEAQSQILGLKQSLSLMKDKFKFDLDQH